MCILLTKFYIDMKLTTIPSISFKIDIKYIFQIKINFKYAVAYLLLSKFLKFFYTK